MAKLPPQFRLRAGVNVLRNGVFSHEQVVPSLGAGISRTVQTEWRSDQRHRLRRRAESYGMGATPARTESPPIFSDGVG